MEQTIDFPDFDMNFRKKLKLVSLTDSNFEKYLSYCIFKNVPICHLEGFNTLTSLCSDLKYNPSLIYTANGHFTNELFKFWAAFKCTEGKAKLIISDHGGAIPSRKVHFFHEESVSDKKVVWHKPYKKSNSVATK